MTEVTQQQQVMRVEPYKGISALVRRERECLLCSFTALMSEDKMRTRRQPSINQAAGPHHTLTLDSAASRTMRNTHLLFKLCPLWYFMLQQPELRQHLWDSGNAYSTNDFTAYSVSGGNGSSFHPTIISKVKYLLIRTERPTVKMLSLKLNDLAKGRLKK